MKEMVERRSQILALPSPSRGDLRLGARSPLAIERPPLNNLLMKGLQRPLLLILAPDGYGKTSALWRAVQGLTHPVIWCALDATETPLTEMIHGVISRLVVTAGGSRRIAEPVERSPFECAQSLVEAAQRALPTGGHLVLDALDKCPGRTDAWAFLRYVLDLAPPGFTVALTTAARPEIRLSDLARKRALAQVGKNRLAFSREEVGAFLSAAWDMPIGEALVDEAYRVTAGWPQGLHALVAVSPEAPRDGRAIGASSAAESFVPPPGDDLLQHVEGLDRELLLSVAFLPTVDLADVEALTGVPGTATRVRRMAGMSQALTQMEAERYVLHPSLRDQLLSTARREWGSDAAKAHHMSVGHLLESRGRLEESLSSFLQAGEGRAVSRTLETLGPRYVMSRDPSDLLPVAARLDEVGVHSPIASLLCARAALARGDFTAAVSHADEGLRTVDADDARLPLGIVRAAARSGLSADLRLEDGWEQLVSAPGAGDVVWPHVWMAAELLRIGRPTDAEEELAKGSAAHDISVDPYHAGWAMLCRAEAYTQTGRYAAARAALEKEQWLAAQKDTLLAAMRRDRLAEVEALDGDLSTALEHARDGVEVALKTGACRLRLFLHLLLSDLSVWQGDLREARRWFDEAEAVARELATDSGGVRHALNATRGRLLWHAGAVDEALEALTGAIRDRGRTLGSELWNSLSAGHVLIRTGREDEAEDAVVEVFEQAEQMESPHLMANALLLLAYGAQTTGDPAEVRDYLRRFWATVRTHGYRFMPASDAELIVWAERNDPAKGETQTRRPALVAPAQHEAGRATLRHVAAGVPWPLADIDTLGPLRITVRGTACEDVWKSSLKAKRLLEIMLSVDGLRTTAEEAADHLWPSAPGDKGKHRLHNEVSNLRRILSKLELEGHVEVRREQDAYRLYCSDQVRVTDRQFAALARRGLAAPGNEQAHRLLTEAAELLAGPFLEDAAYERFPENRRRELLDLAAQCLHALADSPLTTDEDAVTWWERALEYDRYDEDAYEGIVRTCLRLGRTSKAGRYFKLMQDRLVGELGCDPPTWAETLGRQLGLPTP